MNWTKTPPTKPGAYWWKAQTGAIKCCEVFTDREGNSIAQGFGVSDDVELLRGEWCELVPAEDLAKAQAQCAKLRNEVERAFDEAWDMAWDSPHKACYNAWQNSRARKVANGKAVS